MPYSHTTSATSNATPPPPTHNALPAAQRIRLMRSTRKLGEIFGEEPHVLEDDALSSISSSSISSTSTSSSTRLTHSASSSVTSLSSTDDEPPFTVPDRVVQKKKSKSILPQLTPSQPLFLKLNVKQQSRLPSVEHSPTSPVSPLNSMYDLKTPTQASQTKPEQPTLRSRLRSRGASITSMSWDFGVSGAVGVLNGSGSLCRSASISSVSPTTAANAETRLRRKRMAKLKRTLGENVPIELVFGSSSAPSHSKPPPPPVPPMPASILAPTPALKLRPPTPPKIKVPSPVSPPPCLPEINTDESELNPFTDPHSSDAHVRIIGPAASSINRPISTMTTASVYSQPSAGVDGAFEVPLPTPIPTPSPSSARLRPKARSLNIHRSRPRPLSINSPPALPSPFGGKSFLSFSPSTPVPTTPIAITARGINPNALDAETFTPRAGSHSLDLPSSYRRSQWENLPDTPGYHTACHDVMSSGTQAFGRRKEKEWSGEWNKPDMTDVLKGLRGLKAS
ncbi:hypothetical protein PLEOSDRAFT_175530 [Pleurotus ostreatus PC15]|uniref:Uncharacterized protein n=2 Tax=Pleurotus TaxID=5320 RepID=A0A067NPU3_PLEO1|nr:hypothetical protein CCMSSC00406_0008950 [Pleurotus cornucopiae]KDQ30093.1 hypothetical protein PLEOSDRAFT_175530 [Pleurotus ostreatus PC15]